MRNILFYFSMLCSIAMYAQKGVTSEVEKLSLEFKEIKKFDIQFTGEIDIPNELAKVKIEELNSHGKISNEGIGWIKNLLHRTNIIINWIRIE
ncbi:hypothetical protein [uncultured Bacteroides sp.]|uniref:hypothetical protein n=1 Tax=uncultured Bacteroides sp. TaxID=162156 RepID=UPI0025F17D52|nr:hypothetical protein [uncultured Bacteroides sp.]